MSPQVGNFVHDLVEMAKAMDQLPVLEAALDETKRNLDKAQEHNAGLESNIIGYKAQIEDLQAKVRSLEVERDDASFRVLEAEDKAHNVLAMAKAARVSLEQMTGLLDPPKPQPVPEKEPDHVAELKWHDDPKPQDQSVGHLIQSQSTPTTWEGNTSSEEASKSDATSDKSEDKEPSDRYSDEWFDWRAREDKRQGYRHF